MNAQVIFFMMLWWEKQMFPATNDVDSCHNNIIMDLEDRGAPRVRLINNQTAGVPE